VSALAGRVGVRPDTVRYYERTWPTHPCTRPGWTRPRSISPSSTARFSPPNEFTELDQIRDRVASFETRYNAVAKPFAWRFTRNDLDDLLDRIDAHQAQRSQRLAA
jgi:hypothetical protein